MWIWKCPRWGHIPYNLNYWNPKSVCNAGNFTITWNAVIIEKELHIIKNSVTDIPAQFGYLYYQCTFYRGRRCFQAFQELMWQCLGNHLWCPTRGVVGVREYETVVFSLEPPIFGSPHHSDFSPCSVASLQHWQRKAATWSKGIIAYGANGSPLRLKLWQFCNGETILYLSNTCGMVKCQGLSTRRQMLSDHTRCQTTLHHSINGLQDCNSYLQTSFSDDTRVSDLTYFCVSWVQCFVQLNKRKKSSGSFSTLFRLNTSDVLKCI